MGAANARLGGQNFTNKLATAKLKCLLLLNMGVDSVVAAFFVLATSNQVLSRHRRVKLAGDSRFHFNLSVESKESSHAQKHVFEVARALKTNAEK